MITLAIARMLVYSAVFLPLSFAFGEYATEFAQIWVILLLINLAALYGESRQ